MHDDAFDQNIDPDLNILEFQDSCSFLTVDAYNELYVEETFDFSLFSQNIRSYHSKSDLLETFLETIIHEFQCVVLTETFNTFVNFERCNLNGFSSHHMYRSSVHPGGGVSVFCNMQSYLSQKIECLSICTDSIETCVVEMFKKGEAGRNCSLFIADVYRPPSTGNIDEFLIELENILENSILQNKTVFLAGDLNINILNQDDHAVNQYLSCMSSHFYMPTITLPTRIAISGENRTATALDHIFINKIVPYRATVFDYDLSDHCGTVIDCKIYQNFEKLEIKHKIINRPFNQSNFDKLKIMLSTLDWNVILTNQDANTMYATFSKHIDSAYCSCFPLKIKYLSDKRIKKPWITNELHAKIKQKSDYFKSYRRNEISIEINNAFKNKINKEIKNAKNSYFKNIFNQTRQNLKKSWDALKILTGIKGKERNLDGILDNSENKTEVINNFNDFFATIGSKLASHIPAVQNSNPIPEIRNSNSFYLYPVSENELMNIVAKLKSTKSNIDQLPIYLF